MFKKFSMILGQSDLEAVKVRTKTYNGDNDIEPSTVAIVGFDKDTYIQIESDALRGFIEKLEAAEAEIIRKAPEITDREMFQEILQRHGHETGGAHEQG